MSNFDLCVVKVFFFPLFKWNGIWQKNDMVNYRYHLVRMWLDEQTILTNTAELSACVRIDQLLLF